LRDLGKPQGVQSLVSDTLTRYIRKEKREDWLHTLSEAKNFFKHADRDPKTQLSFNPDTTGYFLFDAVMMYQQLGCEQTGLMLAVKAWFALKYPDFLDEEIQDELQRLEVSSNYDPMNRRSFLNLALEFDSIIHGS